MSSPGCPHVSLLSLHTSSPCPCPPVFPAYPIYVCIYVYALTSDCVSTHPCMFPAFPSAPCPPALWPLPWAAPAVCLVPQEASAGTELEDTGAWAPEDAKASDISSLKALGLPQPDFHTLILDLSSFSFVDTVCLKSLKNVRGWGRP